MPISPTETNLDSHFSRKHWGDAHDVIPEFLNFEYRNFNPIEIMSAVTSYIDGVPSTAQTFNSTELLKSIPDDQICRSGGAMPQIKFTLTAHGFWKPPGDHHGGTTVFMNPEYAHLDHLHENYFLTSPGDRLDMLDTVLRHGLLSKSMVANMFGQSVSELNDFLTKHNVDWDTRRTDGLTRTARTWATITNWGYTTTEVQNAFGISPTRYHDIISEHLPNGFTPPQQPSEADATDLSPYMDVDGDSIELAVVGGD